MLSVRLAPFGPRCQLTIERDVQILATTWLRLSFDSFDFYITRLNTVHKEPLRLCISLSTHNEQLKTTSADRYRFWHDMYWYVPTNIFESSSPCIALVNLLTISGGVSYANLSIGSDSVKWIQKWPGRSQANENKVPTIVVYPNSQPVPSSWGFLSETTTEQNADDKDHREWFKTHLDPVRLAQAQRQDPEGAPRSVEEVEKYYTDYLRLLYRHVEYKLSSDIQGATWQNASIEFIFSVPTTWHPEIVEKFRSIAQHAGFGGWPGHSVTVGLTEAEAAAVHTSIEASAIFRERDILLVCDAGGGTTDLSVLRVTHTSGEDLSLDQLDVVYGGNIGSAAIDHDFENLVKRRLDQADQIRSLGISPEEAAWEMMKSKDFQNTKCEHGGPDDTPLFSVPIPRLTSDYVNNSQAIQNGEMRFSRSVLLFSKTKTMSLSIGRGDLCRLFDQQIQKLIDLIDSQLHKMQKKFPNEQVVSVVKILYVCYRLISQRLISYSPVDWVIHLMFSTTYDHGMRPEVDILMRKTCKCALHLTLN